MGLLSFSFAIALALVHLMIGRLGQLGRRPRRIWLSGAAGVAVAYVFLHILPDLAEHQFTVAERFDIDPRLAEVLAFAVSLAGLTIFYGLERLATWSRFKPRLNERDDRIATAVFWAHIGAFALYNVLIGYLLVHPDTPGLAPTVLFFVAMSLHFVTNDVALRDHHKLRYDTLGRWLVAGAVLAGWLLGVTARLPELEVGLLFAFLAGGVVLNVMKEELPAEREGRFLPFLIGVAGYSSVLVLIELA